MIDRQVAAAAGAGLMAEKRWLPSWLLYDPAGCALYEQITQLPEYYLTRAEAEIFERQSDLILALATDTGRRLSFAELGAGSATKTEILLEAAVRIQGSCVYLACDISVASLREAERRLRRNLPTAEIRTAVGTHLDAGPAIASLSDRQVLLFIGSSIGNYTDAAAVQLLTGIRRFLRADAVLVLGTDLAKDPERMRLAYDDAQGVTAAFSKNLLVRLNRDLEADFDVELFQHVAVWDESSSNIEVYLQSSRAQQVWVGALGRELSFGEGERIHTETCAKYDARRVDRILGAAGFARSATQVDSEQLYAVHLARLSRPLA